VGEGGPARGGPGAVDFGEKILPPANRSHETRHRQLIVATTLTMIDRVTTNRHSDRTISHGRLPFSALASTATIV